MLAFMKMAYDSVGYGITEEEATEDAYINSCTRSLNNDVEMRFKNRREELHPWMPLPNMLHISSVGCLVYENKQILETASGNRLVVASTGGSIFRYLANLFGRRLTYTDIVCVLREEIDTFFLNISKEFTPIKDMQIISTQSESYNFSPRALYKTNSNFTIGCDVGYVGIRYQGETNYYVCGVESQAEQINALYRLLYRTGNVLIGDKVVRL